MNINQPSFHAFSPVLTLLPMGRGTPAWSSSLPSHAVARIWRPAKSAMTSGRASTPPWKLAIAPRSGQEIEPLMGWTSSADTSCQVELSFATLHAAMHHADSLGVRYEVLLPPGQTTRWST